MTTSNLPRRFAVAGIVLGFAFMALYWYDYKYNPFNFPTSEVPQTLARYSTPAIYTLIEKAMFVLCPGLLLQILTIGTGDSFAWTMWTLAALINAPIYYCVGLMVAALIKRQRRIPTG